MSQPTRTALSLPVPPDIPTSLELAREARDLGYESAWLADTGGPDPFVLAAALADRVSEMRVGVAVSPAYTRTPAVFASMTGSVAQLMPGRFVLGLGCSSETIVGRWNGVPFEKPLARVRETVTLVRSMLAGEKSDFDGKTVRSHGYRLLAPPPKPVPIYVGALKPPMLSVAGAVGDGVIVNLFPAEALPRMLEEVRAGAAKADRSADDFEVVCRFQVCVTDDPGTARELLRKGMSAYFTTSVYNAFAEWCGFGEEAREMREARAAGDRKRVEAAFTDEMIDRIAIIGDEATCREKIRKFTDAGVTTVVVHPFLPDPETTRRTVRGLAPK